jgi:hypothetical protein
MPQTTIITSNQTWTAPQTAHHIDVSVEAKGGQGGVSDPVQELGGGGGGQGARASVSYYPVQAGWEFGCSFSGSGAASFTREGNSLSADVGGPAESSGLGGYGGDASSSGFDSSLENGANGFPPNDNYGGDGGGAYGNRGTPSAAPGAGQGRAGGGGQALNGPAHSGTGGGAPGGAPRIVIVVYDEFDTQ